MLELFMQPETWLSLFMLTIMEIVLGIDNVIRLILLSMLSYLAHLTQPLFVVMGHSITGRDLVLLGGGLFLMAKTTHEIHNNVANEVGEQTIKAQGTFLGVITQVVILDIVFSFDSVLTAIGLSNHVSVMMIAVVISLIVMLAFSGYISDFIDRNPTMKMLALSFLMLIGFLLVAESFHVEVPKGYIYFAMAFSFGVELLNIQVRKRKANN
jgi:predicted tellurium resistance membrane protein TerC